MRQFNSWQTNHRLNMWLTRHQKFIRPFAFVLLICSMILLIMGAWIGKVITIRFATDLPIDGVMYVKMAVYYIVGITLLLVSLSIIRRIG